MRETLNKESAPSWKAVMEYIEIRGVKINISNPVFVSPMREALIEGWYEGSEAESLSRLLAEGDVLLEVGGGCGFLSAYAAKLGRARKIHTVEANPALLPVIAETHALNGTQAEVHHEVLGPSEEPREFCVNDHYWASSAEGHWGKQHVVTVPGRSWIERVNEWNPSFLLMDIEGGETTIIPLGMPPCIRKIVIELHPHAYGEEKEREMIAALHAMDFVTTHQIHDVYSFTR
jgi:FkbM family methyltransferase